MEGMGQGLKRSPEHRADSRLHGSVNSAVSFHTIKPLISMVFRPQPDLPMLTLLERVIKMTYPAYFHIVCITHRSQKHFKYFFFSFEVNVTLKYIKFFDPDLNLTFSQLQ